MDALSIVDKLKPLKYEKIKSYPAQPEGTWIPTDEEWDGVNDSETPPYEGFSYSEEYGMVAQDVRSIPELAFLVSGAETDESGTQTPLQLQYNSLFTVAIKEIQELKAMNDALEARISALENN